MTDEVEKTTCTTHPHRSVIAVRDMCRECYHREQRLSALQYELFDAVMAHEFSSVNPRTWPRVSKAAHKLLEVYDD